MSIKILINNTKSRLYYISLFRVKIFIQRNINNLLKFNRPISYPFLTGDCFRSLATHVYDDISSINTKKVENNDIIFVRSDMLHIFFKKINPKIKSHFILLSHNADRNIDTSFKKYDLKNIIHWYAQNNLLENSKISSLPIGLSNLRYKQDILKYILSNDMCTNKIPRILSSFNPETNPTRKIAKEFLDKSTVSDYFKGTQKEYSENLNRYCFIASPEGNGIDCHRTWEALYLKTIPIVIRNMTTKYFLSEGIPLLLIDKWEDILNFDEDFLKRKYEELKPLFISENIFLDYWFKKILNSKK